MKKNLRVAFIALFATPLWAGMFDEAVLGVDVGGFYPVNRDVRSIYHDVLPSLGVSLNVPISQDYHGWINIDYIWSEDGHSLGASDPTSLKILPLSIGVKYILPKYNETIDFYVALGAVYSLLWIENDSPYVKPHEFKTTFGGVAKIGVMYPWSERICIDGSLDYLYQRFHFSGSDVESQSANLSGLKIGIGLNVAI